jgi:putative tricarboxylic transport membrane protein
MNRVWWDLDEDRVVALMIMAISAAYGLSARALGSLRSDDAVGPAGFPLLIAVGGLALGLSLWFQRPSQEPKERLGGRVWLYWLVFLVYAFAVHYAGFAISTAVFLTLTFVILKVPSWRAALVAVIVSAVLWLIFAKLLDVRLAIGFWS